MSHFRTILLQMLVMTVLGAPCFAAPPASSTASGPPAASDSTGSTFVPAAASGSTDSTFVPAASSGQPAASGAEAAEQRVRCGDYSYVLPAGFVAVNLPASYPHVLFIDTHDATISQGAERGVVCIQKENTTNAPYLPDLLNTVVDRYNQPYDLEKPKEEWQAGVTVYYDTNYRWNSGWDRALFWAEMDPSGSPMHTILYFWDNGLYREVHRQGRRVMRIEMTDDELEERAKTFVRSIRKEP